MPIRPARWSRTITRICLFFAGLLVALSPSASLTARTTPVIADAPVVLLSDARTGQVLVEKNANHRFIPASVAKVMTAYTAFEEMAAGRLAAAQTITMRPDTQSAWYRRGSTMFIREGQAVSVDTLLSGITAVSANDASVALAEGHSGSVAGWTRLMNANAQALDMRNSHFATPNGWPDEGRSFTTAADLTRLATAMIARHPQRYARYFGQPGFAFNGIAQNNHDPITRRVAGADGIKTGYTRQAGLTFVGSAERDGTRLVMVLAGLNDYDERGELARELIGWGFDAFERRVLYETGTVVGTAHVQDSPVGRISLRTTEPVAVAIPKGAAGIKGSSIRYAGPLRAPVAEGQIVARLVIEIEGMEPVTYPLAATRDAPLANPMQRIANGFRSWLP